MRRVSCFGAVMLSPQLIALNSEQSDIVPVLDGMRRLGTVP